MSNDWEQLIEKSFESSQNKTLNLLMETVREVMDEMGDLVVEKQSPKGPKGRTYTIKRIPLIPISELGWANNESGVQGGTQRALLEDWLRNIEGVSFQDKLANVQTKMMEGFKEIPKDGDVTEYIQKVMSYLVFAKTLTMAITNFNASAAGFNFEAFLATLMAGEQIPASGANTIADFTAQIDGESVPVSLKLYTQGQLEVGGSFTDLSNDLISPNGAWASWASSPEFEGGAMKYVVATKDFEQIEKGASPLERRGTINFYEFDITRKNVFRLMADTSKHSRKCIGSSVQFMDELSEWDKTKQGDAPNLSSTLPSKMASFTEIAELFSNYLKANLPLEGPLASNASEIYKEIAEMHLERMEAKSKPREFPTSAQIKRAVAEILGTNTRDAVVVELSNGVVGLFKSFREQVLKKIDKRAEAIKKLSWMFGEDKKLVDWYESLSPEAKIAALENTYGYLNTDQFGIPNKKAITYGGGKPFAQLQIGAPYVQDFLEKVSNEVMSEVFSIFDKMAEMTEKLNSFFANGLKQKEQAETGAQAGEEAAKGARKFAK